MPTGYTAILQEKPDLPFSDFALRCARAMGACIMQRDDSMDDLPDLDEKPSDYHVEAKEKAINDLRAAEEMTDDQWATVQQMEIRAAIASAEQDRAQRDRWRESYKRMLRKVDEWSPPTGEHTGLKDFMRQQITDSIKWDCNSTYYEESLQKLQAMTVKCFRDERLQKLRRDITYHTEEHRKEVDRVNGRNVWKRQLVDSVK